MAYWSKSALAAAAVVIIAQWSVGRAYAGSGNQNKAKARALLKSGDHHLRRGDAEMRRGETDRAKGQYQHALSDYQHAFDDYPQPQIYYPIARAEEKLGRYVAAYHHYNQVLAEGKGIPDALRAQVQIRVGAVQKHLGALGFVVMPKGAKIAVDGNSEGSAPLAKPLYLAPGKHTFKISADGYSPRQGSVELAAGAAARQYIKLIKIPVVAKKKPQPVEPRPHPVVEPSRVPLAVGITATISFGALATATGLIAIAKHGTFTDTTASLADRYAAADSGPLFAHITDALLVATVAAAGYSAYYYYAVYRPRVQADEEGPVPSEPLPQGGSASSSRRAPPAASGVWVAPYVAGHSGGLAIGGRF